MNSVCILTAGRGTRMGPYAEVINKALLPYNGKAILSHIMDGFPRGTPFVIALGHMGQQVRDYLAAAHPDDDITYVSVDNYDQPGSGPGYSIWCCREHLQRPFYFVAADTVAEFDTAQLTNENWAGVSPVAAADSKRFCNFTAGANGFIDKIYDKQIPPHTDPVQAFVGLMFITDYQVFWDALSRPETVAGEVQISAGLKALVATGNLRARPVNAWKDFGVLDDYRRLAIEPQPYDFSKTDEFIYFRAGRVIKFFKDDAVAQKRVEKALLLSLIHI
jgi:NDP-sugar pyrophosphorylase family protein